MPLLSVIIPIYNLEKYLRECIDSVLNQKKLDMEIILIDDGSTDDSFIICEEYANLDKRFRVIHKENQGQAAARNDGLKLASGKYVLFLDGDDYWLVDVLDNIVNKTIGKQDLDMVLFNYCCCSDQERSLLSKGEHELESFDNDILNGKKMIERLLNENPNFNWYPVLYIIKRDLLIDNSLFFEHGIVYEDVDWVYKMILKCNTVMVSKEVLYCYRNRRSGSTSNNYKYTTEYMKLNVIENNIKWIENNIIDIRLKKLLCNNLSCIFYSALIVVNHIDKNDRSKLFDKINETVWVCKYTTSSQQKLIYNFSRILGLKITCRILYIRSKLRKY